MQDRHQTILAQRYPVPVDDGRRFLPDRLGIGVPIGMKADIARAAAAAGTSASAFVRGAILEKLQATMPAPAPAALEGRP